MTRQLEDGLRVVGHRTVAIDGDGHRAHAEEAEGHQAEGEDRPAPASASAEPERADAVGRSPIRPTMAEAHPEGAEVAGDEAGEDVQRGAALARRRDDLPARAPDSVEVKTLMSSGMIAPASVPQVMIAGELPPERCRRRRSGMSRYGHDVGERRPRRSR